jgi:hypothetical protein
MRCRRGHATVCGRDHGVLVTCLCDSKSISRSSDRFSVRQLPSGSRYDNCPAVFGTTTAQRFSVRQLPSAARQKGHPRHWAKRHHVRGTSLQAKAGGGVYQLHPRRCRIPTQQQHSTQLLQHCTLRHTVLSFSRKCFAWNCMQSIYKLKNLIVTRPLTDA